MVLNGMQEVVDEVYALVSQNEDCRVVHEENQVVVPENRRSLRDKRTPV